MTSLDVAAVYAREWPRVVGYMRRRLRHLSPADHEDMAALVFLRAVQRPYDERGQAGHWLMVVAHHVVIDYVRREAGREAASLHAALPVTHDPYGALADRIVVRELLDELTPKQRAVVVARYWYGYSFAEVAGAFGVSVDGVKELRRRAMQTMRRASARPGGLDAEHEPSFAC